MESVLIGEVHLYSLVNCMALRANSVVIQGWRNRGTGGAQAPPNIKAGGLSPLTFPLTEFM